MPATAAPVSLTKTPSSPFASTPQGRLAARIAGPWPNGLVLGLLLGWLAWILIILTHPLHPTTASALLDATRSDQVQQWAFVEPTSGTFDPMPGLADPMRMQWQIAYPDPAISSAGSGTPASQPGWVAWRDSLGTHVAQLGGSSVRVTSQPGDGWSSETETNGWPSTTLSLPETHRVHDIGALWSGHRLLGPSWLMPLTSLFLAIALLWGQPRFRTRWGWFWLLGTPLGLGFVWMLLREQWFGLRPAPQQRIGGWSSFFTSIALAIPITFVLGTVIPHW